jgi:hypothetical protein
MEEYNLMFPERYQEKINKVWREYDSWKNLEEVDLDDLDDKEKESDDDWD